MTYYSNPYHLLKANGCKLDHHESDLYVLATDEAIAIVKDSKWRYEMFTGNDGELWLDVYFAYEPYWTSRARK